MFASPLRISDVLSPADSGGVTETTRWVISTLESSRFTDTTSPGTRSSAWTWTVRDKAPTGYWGSMEPVRKTTKDALKTKPRIRARMHSSPRTATSVRATSRTILRVRNRTGGTAAPRGTEAARDGDPCPVITSGMASGYEPTVLVNFQSGT